MLILVIGERSFCNSLQILVQLRKIDNDFNAWRQENFAV